MPAPPLKRKLRWSYPHRRSFVAEFDSPAIYLHYQFRWHRKLPFCSEGETESESRPSCWHLALRLSGFQWKLNHLCFIKIGFTDDDHLFDRLNRGRRVVVALWWPELIIVWNKLSVELILLVWYRMGSYSCKISKTRDLQQLYTLISN